ncbi:MAG: carbamoyltransferase HypF [Infirmifilum sp.]
MSVKAYRLRVSGVVQGVGFRPHVYRIASKLGLKGYVVNLGGSEVEIWVEGPQNTVESFPEVLRRETPPSAEIEELHVEEVQPAGFTRFEIRRSDKLLTKISMIPPDFGICDDCKREILDPSSRWYRYPFHSCAWCGPRFTIIRRIPYDRENTSMDPFPLCLECRQEYSDPENLRRFHIQGISCPNCGPQVFLVDRNGAPLRSRDPILDAAKLIDEGFIVAVKGIGGFHLAAKATDDAVLKELRRRKKRGRKPFAVMALDITVARRIAVIDDVAESLLKSPARPIVILPRTREVSPEIAPGLKTVGVMLAYTPLHYLLLQATRDKFAVMTSGNESGEPMIKENEEAVRKLNHVADFFLLHNREIVNRVDDSVLRLSDGVPTFLRRSRGYAPKWIRARRFFKRPIIALGSILNNTGAVGVEEYVIPTQHIGDLENIETLEFLKEALNFLIQTYEISPGESLIVVDKHPLLPSRRLAEQLAPEGDAEIVEVQHHVAHTAAVLLEKGTLEGYGIAIDGVGYGDDGMIWGGEVIHIGEDGSYSRVGKLDYLPLPGGDRATIYPARILIGLLAEYVEFEEALKYAVVNGIDKRLPGGIQELMIAYQQSKTSIKCSSAGRFLDAVAALLGVSWERTYEGEPAITLEEYSWGGNKVNVKLEHERGIVHTKDFFQEYIFNGRFNGINPRDLAYTIQFELGRALAEIAREEGAREVYVSGGAAVNTIILKGIKQVFSPDRVFIPSKLPPGDGGISAGQVYYMQLRGLA